MHRPHAARTAPRQQVIRGGRPPEIRVRSTNSVANSTKRWTVAEVGDEAERGADRAAGGQADRVDVVVEGHRDERPHGVLVVGVGRHLDGLLDPHEPRPLAVGPAPDDAVSLYRLTVERKLLRSASAACSESCTESRQTSTPGRSRSATGSARSRHGAGCARSAGVLAVSRCTPTLADFPTFPQPPPGDDDPRRGPLPARVALRRRARAVERPRPRGDGPSLMRYTGES
jgi:hypothetical protein